jgi:hypothetical protein
MYLLNGNQKKKVLNIVPLEILSTRSAPHLAQSSCFLFELFESCVVIDCNDIN